MIRSFSGEDLSLPSKVFMQYKCCDCRIIARVPWRLWRSMARGRHQIMCTVRPREEGCLPRCAGCSGTRPEVGSHRPGRAQPDGRAVPRALQECARPAAERGSLDCRCAWLGYMVCTWLGFGSFMKLPVLLKAAANGECLIVPIAT